MSTAFPINDDARVRISTATSGQTVFSVPFPFQVASDIAAYKVLLNGTVSLLARPADYTLTGAGDPAGGSLTLKSAAKAGEKIIRVGRASLTRVQSITRAGKFDSAAADADFDRLTLIAQEQARDLTRAALVPFGETGPELVAGIDGELVKWQGGKLVPGPDAAALEAVETALGVAAGRALVYPGAPADPIYDAGNRKIGNLAAAELSDEAVTLAQLEDLANQVGVDALIARIEALEAAEDRGWQTGDLKYASRSSAVDGWLKANGQTIGDEGSGATALAHGDAWPLFLHLWTETANDELAIQNSSGAPSTRGVSAAADFAALKRLPLPDLRAQFLRGLDDGRGVDATRALGSAQAGAIESHTHAASAASAGAHTHAVGVYDGVGSGSRVLRGNGSRTSQQNSDSAGAHTHTVTVTATGDAETRPRNSAFLILIKL